MKKRKYNEVRKDPSRNLRYMRRYRADKREKLDSLKASTGCIYCLEKDPRCLQFHHKDPSTKKLTISRMYGGTWSWESILKEIEKCDIICSNCHLKHHRILDESKRIKLGVKEALRSKAKQKNVRLVITND